MNYTNQVREYCGKHSKGLIDISVVRNTVFADIPYKTLLKIFNRLEEEGIVKTVSKGVYSIGGCCAETKKYWQFVIKESRFNIYG